MNKLLSIGEASTVLGVTPKTVRLWEREGKIISHKTKGGHRRFTFDQLFSLSKEEKITLGYARVSTVEQKEDLNRQIQLLELYCNNNNWKYEIISDLGSGINYNKKGLRQLIKLICSSKIQRLVLTNKDRLLRFGADLIFMICEIYGIEIVIVNQTENFSFEEELTQDVLEIITVFSARLYGSRSGKNKKIIEELQSISQTI